MEWNGLDLEMWWKVELWLDLKCVRYGVCDCLCVLHGYVCFAWLCVSIVWVCVCVCISWGLPWEPAVMMVAALIDDVHGRYHYKWLRGVTHLPLSLMGMCIARNVHHVVSIDTDNLIFKSEPLCKKWKIFTGKFMGELCYSRLVKWQERPRVKKKKS